MSATTQPTRTAPAKTPAQPQVSNTANEVTNNSATSTAEAAAKKRNTRAKMTMDHDALTVTFAWDRQLSGEAPGSFVARIAELPRNIVDRLAVDRLRNKLMDSYSDPASSIMENVTETYAALKNGEWGVRGEATPATSLFAEAYAELKKVDIERVRAAIADPSKTEALKAWRVHPDIRRITLRMQQERLANAAPTATPGDLV